MPTTPIPGGYRLSATAGSDTVLQRRSGRGQTLVLTTGLAGSGAVTQSPTDTSGLPTAPGMISYQIPTQGTARIFQATSPVPVAPGNGAAASDGYRVFQFGGSFEDTLGTENNNIYISTQSNRCTIVSPGVASATTFNLLEVQSDNAATGTDTRLFTMGGWVKNSTNFTEIARQTVSVINPANLAEGYWSATMNGLVNATSENDGDIFIFQGGRFMNSTTGNAQSGIYYFSMATGTGAVDDQNIRGVDGGWNSLPRAAGAGSATDGSRIVIGGGNQIPINGGNNSVTSNMYTIGFRVPVLTSIFGDLTQARTRTSAGTDGSRAVFVGGCSQLVTAGYTGFTNYSTMDKITISTPGTATTFGEIEATTYTNVDDGSGTFSWQSTTGITPSRAYGVASAT